MSGQTARPAIDPGFPAGVTAAEIARGHDLRGRTAIVTGASGGLGRETARVLALQGADVILAVRDPARGAKVAAAIDAEAGGARTRVETLDLADLRSVAAFVASVGERPTDLLIANAGVMACPLGRTADGFETQFGVNHLGHFALVTALLPNLRRSGAARVVSIASGGHILGDIDFDDPNYQARAYEPFAAYGQSKTANILFALELDRRERGHGIRAFSLDPGATETDLLRHMTPDVLAAMGWSDGYPFPFATPAEGAATILWAALGPELAEAGGLYLDQCREAPLAADGVVGGVLPRAIDPVRAAALWDMSERLVKR